MPTSGSPILPELAEPGVVATNRVWDAIVVGAGPAGSAAAFDLASAGRSVLLLNKKTFPRQKACAGGLTVKAVNALRYSISPVVRETVNHIELAGDRSAASASSGPLVLKSRSPICVMTVRAELDAYCLQQTVKAGAVFATTSPIQRIEREGDCVRLVTRDHTFQARFLVGADGANGQVRTLCAEGAWFRRSFALEVQVALPAYPVALTFDFAAVADGYGWIFPKRDHVNLGLYVQTSGASLTRSHLLQYVKQTMGTDALHPVVGQYLGMGAGEFQPECMRAELRGRVFLTGDAGGFVDALTGEGIYGALVSGQAAATAILSVDPLRTFAACLENYRQTLSFSSRAAGAFYANPARGFRLMRLPLVRSTLIRTYTHGLNVRSLPMRIALARA